MATTDKNGREIMLGDTLKIYHFTGARRKKHFMYKYVQGETARFFEISHLNPKNETYYLFKDSNRHDDIEIVQGFGSDGKSFEERPTKA